MKKLMVYAGLTLAMGFGVANATRQMEALDRGLVAVKVSNGVYLSWRVLGTDGNATGFNLYRDGSKIASFDGKAASNYTDPQGTSSSKYEVRPVVNGTEKSADKSVSVWGSQQLVINLDRPAGGSNASGSYTYSPNDIAVGDVDGDGEYELILKWDPSNSKDNSQKGYTGNVFVDCYKFNGKKLWRIDLGVNIRAGAHYTQMLVGDYDSDGKAEVAMKTAPGTKDGSGKYISKGAAASETNHTKDYRNSSGYVLSGNEYLTIFNGETGVEMATVNYNPARGTVSSWGDSYGNRVDRFLATNAYLDGQKPSMVFQRGYYTRMAVAAFDWDGKTLSQRWYYNAATKGSECYGQGDHNLSAGDVDEDGFDEIIEGACAIDHNGKFMYRTGLGHGDAIHFGDLDPDHEGLEVWQVHEDKPYGYELHDARTGTILWRATSDSDNGRGLAADVDSTSRGHEMWSTANSNVYSAKGTVVGSRYSVNFRIYWDGDLQDELLDGNKISKWNYSSKKFGDLVTLEGNSCNTTKATPNFSGDLFGDWREEVILHDGASKLYVYTTTIPTTHRLYTLAHDPIYRNGMSWQNTAYNQPPHLGFWLGAGIDKAPTPDIMLVGGEVGPKIPAIQKQGAGSSFQTIMLGDAITEYAFGYSNCDGLTITGLPAGVTATLDAANSRYVISGTPTKAGVYDINIVTKGGSTEVEAATRTANITVLTEAKIVSANVNILSSLEACVLTDGVGSCDSDNRGFLDTGFFNFTNVVTSYGIWDLYSPAAHENATLVIRYAHGKTDTRKMELFVEGTSYGVATFPPTADWVTWDSIAIKVNLKKGVNVLKLQSVSELGGPNIDQLEFDVAGIVFATDESIVDSDPEEGGDVPESSSSAGEPASSSSDSGENGGENPGSSSSEDKDGIFTNTLHVVESGMAQVQVFDLMGHRVATFSAEYAGGVLNAKPYMQGLPSGVYMVRANMGGHVTMSRMVFQAER
ncbi:hypothetical protein [Fibrobacter sp. UWEL]|uniref:rhamnogalacturonan lyase family protein n=1 Tax=Fibrobacter sp. UWEL TaxID=1896209 RepID=UPI00091294BB|nr:hypothetical protein [Fibrobacter sp. UWEL]SHK96074.1 rhamnogalacturonan endolyase [Fibrobacter sp. UWEL]